jgi:hypothetical protein
MSFAELSERHHREVDQVCGHGIHIQQDSDHLAGQIKGAQYRPSNILEASAIRPNCEDAVKSVIGVASGQEFVPKPHSHAAKFILRHPEDLRRLRLKGLAYRPAGTHRYFVTPYGWKVARLFSRLEARVFRPAMAMFTANDAVLPFPLRQALDRVDSQLDLLIYDAFPLPKAS